MLSREAIIHQVPLCGEDVPSSIPFPPTRVFPLSESRLLVTGVDGEMQILDETLEPVSSAVRPFPTAVDVCCVQDDAFYGCWLDRELLVARMSCLDLGGNLEEGCSREQLRRSLSTPTPGDVAGARWSHVLEAEPLAITASPERIAFAVWNRGIYCIDADSAELWRSEPIPWKHTLEDAKVPVEMEWTIDGLLVWSRGGMWALLATQSGDLQRMGDIEIDIINERVIAHGDERLMFDPSGRAVWLSGDLERPQRRILTAAGPLNAAGWDDGIAGWRICAWRDDIIWTVDSEQRHRRRDLGTSLIQHDGGWLVLDNIGNWSTHMDSV